MTHFIFSLFALLAFAQPPFINAKFEQKLVQKLTDNKTAPVLIGFENTVDLSQAEKISDRTKRIRFVYDQLRGQALKTQAPAIALLKKMNKSFKSYYINNMISVENISAQELQSLSALQNVKKLSLNATFKMSEPMVQKSLSFLQPIDPSMIPDHLKTINADKAWADGFYGQGIVIAGQDTGYAYQHSAIKRQYRGNSLAVNGHDFNWHDAIRQPITGVVTATPTCAYDSSEPCDDSSHGTHTMGTMLGDDGAQNKIGVAPQAQWIGCRNMDQGNGRPSTYVECFEFFLAPYAKGADPKTEGHPEYAPHVINNSWGCPASEQCLGGEFEPVLKALDAAGIFVVVSAGNDGPECGTVGAGPAFHSADIVFSVGALNHITGEITDFSSRGPSTWDQGMGVSISAPGYQIRSAVPSFGAGTGDNYASMSGTSMAGPHVAGAIAVLWSARPDLVGKIKETKDVLQRSAQAKTSTQSCGNFAGNLVPNAVYGYGVIDIYKAIQTR